MYKSKEYHYPVQELFKFLFCGFLTKAKEKSFRHTCYKDIVRKLNDHQDGVCCPDISHGVDV